METTPIKMVIQLEDKAEIERLISLLNLGICAALEKGALAVEDTQSFIINQFIKCNNELLNL